MNTILKLLTISFVLVTLFVSCSKKPLTLDNETSMKTLLKASDSEITELIKKEANEKGDIPEENLEVEYILRDEKSQTIAVKLKIQEQQFFFQQVKPAGKSIIEPQSQDKEAVAFRFFQDNVLSHTNIQFSFWYRRINNMTVQYLEKEQNLIDEHYIILYHIQV